jgi:hypothetical protein
MTFRTFTLILFLALAAYAPADLPTIKYASPTDFRDVPQVIVDTLLARKCVIPQSGAESPLENIVSGHFIARDRRDFAILCSVAGASRVVVINGDTGSVIALLNRQPDSTHLMAVGDRMLFMRSLNTIEADHRPYCFEVDRTCPCSGARYDGIVDEYEKWSETHCWENGWHTVTSGD